jgi:hypothetical protein
MDIGARDRKKPRWDERAHSPRTTAGAETADDASTRQGHRVFVGLQSYATIGGRLMD